jgi:hypothetical protein
MLFVSGKSFQAQSRESRSCVSQTGSEFREDLLRFSGKDGEDKKLKNADSH